jgi:hypothetical protein
LLLSSENSEATQLIARLTDLGAEALNKTLEAVLPISLGGDGTVVAMNIEASAGEYRAGDQLWLRQSEPEDFGKLLNRDVLAPRPSGRFAFGRMIDRDGGRIAILPPGAGSKQVVVENPAWLAAAEMLVRKL